jgi:predicted nucleic acid-binding protein
MENQQNNTGLTVKEEMELRAKIAKKITKIGVEIGKLKADGKNTFSNYAYISAEQMNAEIREKSEDFGLCIMPSVVSSTEQSFTTTETDAKGVTKTKMTIRTAIVMSIDLIDSDTGYIMNYQFTGSDQDTGGKSEQQAISQCFKYFLFKVFKVSTKDEQDGDSKTTEMSSNKGNNSNKTVATPQKETAPTPQKTDLTDKILAKVIEKVRNEGHKVWETNKAIYNYTPEQEKQINDTKVILTAEKVETIIAAINSGKTTVWEKNKAKYEYTDHLEAQITEAIKLVIAEKDKVVAAAGDNFVGDAAKALLN